jgi:hypothetical protein
VSTTYDPAPLLDRLFAVTGRQPKAMSGGNYAAVCPAHPDSEPSLSITIKDDRALLHCHANCGRLDVLGALDLKFRDLFAPRDLPDIRREVDGGQWMPCGHTKVASYRYHDQHGNLVFGVARCDRKGNGCQGFRQWRPDPTSKSGRKWSLTLPDGGKVGEGLPYRLPEVLAAIPRGMNVWLPEGEKDVDRLWSLGYAATTNAAGAGKWLDAHARWLAGADVMIIADRDEPGWKHAEHVVATLLPIARSVEVLRAAEGKDLSNHLDAGFRMVDLVQVAYPKPSPAVGADGHDIPAGNA